MTFRDNRPPQSLRRYALVRSIERTAAAPTHALESRVAWAVGATSVVGLVFVLGTLHPGALLASLLVGGAVGSLAGKSAGLTSRSAQRLRRRRWFSKHHRAIGRLGDRDAP